MRTRTGVAFLAVSLLLVGMPASLTAQDYQPSVGQQGKDVIWVPTPEELVSAMLDMAKVGPGDFVMDLGSGDGRVVIAAAKRGIPALGIEYNPDMVALSKSRAQSEGVADKAEFRQADIFETDFSKATVVTMYLLPHLNLKLRPKILELKPGTRIVSHAFDMDDWEADETASVEERTAYLWIVPAKVAGTWVTTGASGREELTLRQTYQKVEGTVKANGKETPIENARLIGDRVSFTAGGGNPSPLREYTGRVNGSRIEGGVRVSGQPEGTWSAERVKTP